MKIPVVDFSCLLCPEPDHGAHSRLVDEVYNALSTVGFMYIKNHGVTVEQLAGLERCAHEFFSLPRDVKQKYARIDGTDTYGWVESGREQLNPDQPYDIKESYNIARGLVKTWPDTDVPAFEGDVMTFYEACCQLSYRVMAVMAEGLKMKDKEFFKKCHNFETKPNRTTFRMLHYPAIAPGTEVKPGQLRCGDHSDYGSITLLFQESVGGLQVMSRAGDWVDATPIPGTVLVNIGDLMQRWTNNKLVSTRHRVVIPEDDIKRQTLRHSYALFIHPDADYVIECVDGSNAYPPITSQGYLEMLDKLKYKE